MWCLPILHMVFSVINQISVPIEELYAFGYMVLTKDTNGITMAYHDAW